MERLILILAIIGAVFILSIVLNVYNSVAEPFVLSAVREPITKNSTGKYTDIPGQGKGFIYCKKDDDTSDENSGVPTCSDMRKGMIQKARDENQIPELSPVNRMSYPANDENEVAGDVANLQVILNRTAKKSRQKMCVPFVDCDKYVNSTTRRLYCPVGVMHSSDTKGNTVGCHTFPENPVLNCETTARAGDGRVACSILQNIQTVGPGFKMYPPHSTIKSLLQLKTDTLDKFSEEKKQIILNMIRSYTGIISKVDNPDDEISTHHVSILDQYYKGLMETYILYQPVSGGNVRVGFIKVPGKTPIIPDLRGFNSKGDAPDYEIRTNTFIPDTLSPPDDIMPIVKPHKMLNNPLPNPSTPLFAFL